VWSIENLVKRYGKVVAVDGVSFEVREGEVYGLLGPNGAGKTTTISMLCGLLSPDEGRVRFDGVDVASRPIEVKSRLGVVPQETALYEELSARENLRFWGSIYGLSGAELKRAVDRALEIVGLEGRAKDPPASYSGGMKRRLNLALGMVHSPRALLLDEPTVGIDPQARNRILGIVRDVASAGTTVLYTTHYLEEAESLCDRIGIMDHGRILAEGTLEELRRQAGEEGLVTVSGSFEPDQARAQLDRLPSSRIVGAEPGKVTLAVGGSGEGVVAVFTEIFRQGGLTVDGISIRPPSLNSLFLTLTGRELRD